MRVRPVSHEQSVSIITDEGEIERIGELCQFILWMNLGVMLITSILLTYIS
jgi:hypothetical protein